MADRDVTVDILATDKTASAARSAARNFDRLNKSSNSSRKTLEKDAKRVDSVFTTLFGGLVKAGQKSGLLAGDAAIDGLSSAFKALPPEIKIGVGAAIAAGAVAAVPVVVAAVDAALLAGLGAGGLAAGIALAAQDTEVAQAYAKLGTYIRDRLRQSVLPFKSELIGAAEDFGLSFDAVAPHVDKIFRGLSSTIRPLAQGLGKALENAAPGLEKAFAASLPLIRDLARWLPKLGQEIGDFGQSLAQAGPEAELFFKFLLANVDVAVKGLTFLNKALAGISGAAQGFVGSYRPISPALADSADAADLAGQSFQTAGDSIADMTSKINSADATIDSFSATMTDKLIGSMLGLDGAALDFAESLTSLDEAFKENGRQLDIHSKKGQANREAVLGSVQANLQQYDAMIASGASAQEAAAAYDKNTAALERQLRKAGLTQKEIDGLIGKYKTVPDDVNTNVVLNGVAKALEDLNDTLRAINHLPSNKTITVTTVYKVKGGPAVQNSGNSRPNSTGSAFSALDGWRPAQFAASAGAAFAGAVSGTGGRTVAPYQVSVDNKLTVLIDEAPVRRVAARVAKAEAARNAWQSKAGKR